MGACGIMAGRVRGVPILMGALKDQLSLRTYDSPSFSSTATMQAPAFLPGSGQSSAVTSGSRRTRRAALAL